MSDLTVIVNWYATRRHYSFGPASARTQQRAICSPCTWGYTPTADAEMRAEMLAPERQYDSLPLCQHCVQKAAKL